MSEAELYKNAPNAKDLQEAKVKIMVKLLTLNPLITNVNIPEDDSTMIRYELLVGHSTGSILMLSDVREK